jgi:hypothetical protein
MPQLNTELGSYDIRGMVRMYGSFQVNGTSTPDNLRDGKRASFTVARTSAGLFTVTFTGRQPLPQRLIYGNAHIAAAATLTAKSVVVHIVEGSYSQANRNFQIVCHVVGDVANSAYTDPVVGDPNDNDRIFFELVGSITKSGTDAS